MRKMTLLAMVQNIASALETDEINSITDTTESLQIAEVIRETYYEQFNDINIPEIRKLFQLENVSDVNRPNYLRIPDNISNVDWIRYYDYGLHVQSEELDYVSPNQFFETALRYWTGSGTHFSTVIDGSGLSYLVPNNSAPSYFTILDDNLVVFDSFDRGHETTMLGTNSLSFGTKTDDFVLTDLYIPPIDANLFPLLLAESKATCFINLKQISSSKEEQKARRQRIRMQSAQYKSRQAQHAEFNRRGDYSRHRG